MRKSLRLLLNLIAFQYFLVMTARAIVQEKSEAAMPAATLSPPEGNTTFLDGTTWCVARPGVSQADLQVALDWACGLGKADCGPIQSNGLCFEPNTLLSHASYAFNSYYQQNGNSDIACYFAGTAVLTQTNPSYAKCVFDTSESLESSSAIQSKYMAGKGTVWWTMDAVLLLMYLVN